MDIWFTLFVTVAGLLAAGGFSLLLIGYISSLLACFAYGARWALTVLLLPFVGGIWFAYAHRDEHLKTGRQLLAGLICLVAALAMLYGGGPSMVRYMAENMKNEQAAGSTSAPTPAVPVVEPATKP